MQYTEHPEVATPNATHFVLLFFNHTSLESSMRTVDITKEPVELYKILKFEGLVATGGEAKLVIASGQVTVNGEVETRKRKKIVAGDTIAVGDEVLQIRLA